MLNAIEPSSPLPIHRHKYTSETVVCLRGRIVEEFYDELERICTDRIELTPGGPNFLVNVPAGQWHTVRALESGSVLLECKDGKWEPLFEAIFFLCKMDPHDYMVARLKAFKESEACSCLWTLGVKRRFMCIGCEEEALHI